MSVVEALLPVALAAAFAAAALAKLSDVSGFRAALLGFGLPWPLTTAFALVVPGVELTVAAAMVVSPLTQAAAMLAALLLAVFTATILAALATGRRPSCGCFGGTRAIGPHTLVRNGVLMATALVIAISGGSTGLPVVVEVTVAIALVVSVLAIASYRQLRSRGEELLRRDVLANVAAEADAMSLDGSAALAAFAATALVVPAVSAARPVDDLEALRALLRRSSPQLVGAGRRAGVRIKVQGLAPDRSDRRAAVHALAAQRRLLLDVRADVLALQIEDARAVNARRLAAESLALFAASIARVEAATRATPKTARRQLTEANELLHGAVYRGSRAGYLLKP